MQVFIDESGDFSLKVGPRQTSILGALIVPENLQYKIDKLISKIESDEKSQQKDEIKGHHLSEISRLKVFEFLEKNPQLKMVVFITDNHINTEESVKSFREKQTEKLETSLKWYKEKGGKSQNVIEHINRIIKINRYASRVSDDNYLQAQMLVNLLHESIQQSLLFYHKDASKKITKKYWPCFNNYVFTIDGKLKTHLSPMEKYVSSNIKLMIGFNPGALKHMTDQEKASFISKQRELIVLKDWQKMGHPFIAKYDTPDGISVNKIFEHGLKFINSKSSKSLMLIDIIVNTIKRAIELYDSSSVEYLCFCKISENLSSLTSKELIHIPFLNGGGKTPSTSLLHKIGRAHV
jgi:hypothetical protein